VTPYTAIGIAEGRIEVDTGGEVLEAWQYLHDTGLGYTLQGWFGRQLAGLIEDGLVHK